MMLDINLLPKKTKRISSQIVAVLVLIGMIFVVVAGVFGVFIPLQKKNDLNNKISKVKENIEQYNVSDAEYYQLFSLVENKRLEGDALLYLRNNRRDITDFLDNIEATLPEDIYLNTLKISGTSLNIVGSSKDYTNISKFLVKLRTIDNIFNTKFTEATLTETVSNDEYYSFNIYGFITHRDIIEELQMVGTQVQQPPSVDTSKGGEAQ